MRGRAGLFDVSHMGVYEVRGADAASFLDTICANDCGGLLPGESLYSQFLTPDADVDEWGWGDKNKFKFDGIPIYYKLDGNGNPTGAAIDGGAWGENIPENFAPVLDEFFHTP